MQEIDRLRKRLEEVERELGEQHDESNDLRARIASLEAQLGRKKPTKPNQGKRPKLDPAQRRALNQELAALAREKKRVGKGKGCVSKETKKRMRDERKGRG